MSLLILRDRVSWFGSHTGYEQLTRFLPNGSGIYIVSPRHGKLARYSGSAYGRLHGRMGRGATDLSELEFRLRYKLQQPHTSHVLYLETHLNLFNSRSKAPKDVMGTIHLPASVWKPEQCNSLRGLTSALILYRRDIPFFENYVGNGRVKFIHHGADVEFFKPDFAQIQMPARILYSGVYLRNEPMLVRVLQRLAEKLPELRFDLLVPKHHRASPALASLQQHPSVTWHAGLNDEELRALYQRSYLMMLPMNDSGANTSVVEALASGLPLVTTNVGGIEDYGGGTIFQTIANNDDQAMVSLVEQYLAKPVWRDEIARKCRQFAEDTLTWPVVVQKHLDAYRILTA